MRCLRLLFCASCLCAQSGLAEDGPCIDSPGWPCTMNDEVQYEATVLEPHAALSAGTVSISQERILRAGPTSGSETLGLVPGLRIVQHGSEGKAHQIFLRGFDAIHGSDVEVRLEGIPLNERANAHGHGYVDLYGVIPEVISSMRVHKGPFLPWQGDFATAGSVSYELGIPDELRPGIVKTEVGHRGRLRAMTVAAPRWGREEGFVAGEAVYDAGFGPDREASRGALLVKQTLPIDNGWRIEALLSGQAARWESAGTRRLDDAKEGFYASYGPAGRGESERGLGKLGLSRRHGSTDLELGIYGGVRQLLLEDNYTGHLLHSAQGDLKRQEQGTVLLGALGALEQRLAWPVSTDLLAGLDWRWDRGAQSEKQITSSGDIWQDNRELDTSVHSVAAYLGLRLLPWARLRLLPALRTDGFFYRVEDALGQRHATRVQGAVSPRLAMSLTATPWLRFLADYGRGLRSFEPRAITAQAISSVEDETLAQYKGGRPVVAKADAVEAGIEVSPLAWLELRACGFGTWIEREIVFDHVSNTNLELDGTRRLGAEASIHVSPWSYVSLNADAVFVNARFNRSSHPVPGTAPWSGSATLGLGLDRGAHGSLDVIWNGQRLLAHGASIAGQALLDLGAGWRWTDFDVSLLVDNALNARTMDGAYHYASWFDTDEPRSGLPVIHYTATRPLTARIVFTAFL